MAQKIPFPQTNFTSGVIDPLLAGREDIVFYYNGLKDGKNLRVIPQGGVTRRPALQFAREMSPVLEAIDITAATVTAPHGGTTGNLKDGDEETLLTTADNFSNTNPFVIAKIDLGAPADIAAVDVINYKLSGGVLTDEVRVQTSTDDAAYSDFGMPFDWDATERSRRLRNTAGPVTARYLQIVRVGATNLAATGSIGEVRLWEETETLSAGRLLPFAYSTLEAYMMAVTGGNIDVLKGDDYHGSIAIPHASAQMPALGFTQTLDTMLLFHGNVKPWKIFRQGGNDEFDFRFVNFTNIPQHDYGAGTGGVDEVQRLSDAALLTSSDQFTILLEGKRTVPIIASGTRAGTATAIETALRALANTSTAGITVAADSTDGFLVTFGGDDGKQEWGEMSVSVLTGTSVWAVSRVTEGQPEGEDIMSATRGWPRAGAFHQSRLHLGGVPGVPDGWLASVIGDYYNFDTRRDNAERALMIRAESDQVGAIYQIVAGKHLTFLTNDGEFYIPSEKIDHESVPKWTTDAGSKEGLRVFRVEGGLIFVQAVTDDDDGEGKEVGTSIHEFIYDETIQGYRANMLSKLSSHLIKNPVDMALRKAKSTEEANLLLIVNEDGTGASFTVLREDEVNAFMPYILRGGDKLLATGVDKRGRIYFMTERVIDGVTRRYIEIENRDLFLDCGGVVTIEAEELTAADDEQDVFTWTMTSPATAEEIGVRIAGGRLDAAAYVVNLGAKTVTIAEEFAAEIEEGDIIRIAKMKNEVTGLDHLSGETVQTFIDGTEGDDFEIIAGVLQLDRYADTEIQYGFDFEVDGELMPLRDPEGETLASEKIAVKKVIVNVNETSGIEIRANNSTKIVNKVSVENWQEIKMIKMDDNVLDKSTMELLATGEFWIEGLLGSDVGAPLKFRQPGPGPFTLNSIVRVVGP